MRSPMIEALSYIPTADKAKYSDLRVLRSGAGYYVGTVYINGEDDEFPGLVEPGSRDTGYYATEEEAARVLADLERDPDSHPVRMEP